jgi:hypothetical protein
MEIESKENQVSLLRRMLTHCISFLQRLFGKKQSSLIVTSATVSTTEALITESEHVALPESVLEPFPGRNVEAQPVVQQEQSINPKEDPLYYVDPTSVLQQQVANLHVDMFEPIPSESAPEDIPPLSITPVEKQDVDQTVEEYIPMIEKMD